MESSEFPPNSDASKRSEPDKHIERVTSGETVRRKKSLRKKFSETFIAGDAKTAFRYAVMDVVLPMARDMVLDAIQGGLEKLIYGESRRYRGSLPPQSGPMGYVNYSRYSGPMGASRPSSYMPAPQRVISRQARARHDFDEILLDSRTEAEEVIDRLFDLVSRYESATVADLYELVGLASNHTDHKWGWTDIRGAGVSRTRDGYLLDLPEPQPIG
jgi:hypothetical protein